MEKTITQKLEELKSPFTLKEAYKEIGRKEESIRARIYEAIDKGILSRISAGVFINQKGLLIQGDGRDLSFLKDESIDCIVTDHPYDLKASNKGGNRNFAEFDCFRYNQDDMNEKARVLKKGHFLVEFLPEENGDNYDYLYQIKDMAKNAGLEYYASVPWVKEGFVSNCGRKSKNTETVMIFTKGKARALRHNAKKEKANPGQEFFMSGTSAMLPTDFLYRKQKPMIHKAEKPSALLEAIINYITKEEEVVLDQFAGSGSTGEACMNSNRRFILIELDEEMTIKIKERLSLA